MLTLLAPLTLSGVLLFLIAWVLLMPTKAERVAGWLWSTLRWMGRFARRNATALKIQSQINCACEEAFQSAPKDVLQGRAKVRFRSSKDAEAVLGKGRVLVVMRQREHQAQNVAHGLMAYLPRAVLPRARRYLGVQTMQAADLTLARTALAADEQDPGALQCFYDELLDPALESNTLLQEKITALDEIDLHGWLTRLLLAEYRAIGDRLYPGARHPAILTETERLADWLHGLASLGPKELAPSLRFEGKLVHVAVIFVALRQKLEEEGITPYRSRAKNHIYKQRVDAVYLMARDQNIAALKDLVKSLEGDAMISEAEVLEYPLREDFAARKLPRERGAVAVLRRRRTPGEALVPISTDHSDTFLPADDVFRPTAEAGERAQASEDAAAA